MTVTRAIAAKALFAGLAVSTASTAWADTTMSGHYIETETAPTGLSTTNDWYVTPCGDGCAFVDIIAIGMFQARLVNGQWTMDTTGNAVCGDGSQVPNALSDHYAWDPNTLAGIVQLSNNVPACGYPPGKGITADIQLRQAP
jgi:hypothetical protein